MSAIGIVEYIGDFELPDKPEFVSIAVRIIAGHLDTEVELQVVGGSERLKLERFGVVNAPEGYAEGVCMITVRKLAGDTTALTAGSHLDVLSA